MSDSKLRELERRWRETQSVEDEAAYLRERVRVGDLTQERLELAARTGLPAAETVTGLKRIDRTSEWLHAIGSSSREAAIAAAWGAIQPVVTLLAKSPAFDSAAKFSEVISRWLQTPSAATRNALALLMAETDTSRWPRYATSVLQAGGALLAEETIAIARGVEESEAHGLRRLIESSGGVAVVIPNSFHSNERLRVDAIGLSPEGIGRIAPKARLPDRASTIRAAIGTLRSAADPLWRADGLDQRAIDDAARHAVLAWALGTGR